MEKTTNRFCGFGVCVMPSLLLAALCFFVFPGYSQDSISLKEVEIISHRQGLSRIGKKVEKMDSAALENNLLNSLGDLLNNHTGIFIKNYGPGAVATSAFRGGNASQTAVLWNGFNFENRMLGLSDLALIPSFLFESVEMEYGGSSSLWGSGAVGGSILLNNNNLFKQGTKSSTCLNMGSIGQSQAATGFLVSRSKFVSHTKVYFNNSSNNFTYLDTNDKINPYKRQRSGEYSFIGLMQQLKFLIGQKQTLTFDAWLNKNKRHIPGFNLQEQTKTYQNDDALRLTGNWTRMGQKTKTSIRAAYFNERINYDDSLTASYSKNKIQNLIIENENYLDWKKGRQFNFGINYTGAKGNSNNYLDEKTVSKLSVIAGNKFVFLNNKLIAYAAGRLEYFSVGALPITGNLSAQYEIKEGVFLMLNAAKVYRQPTLNELYWLPGGNKNLKPEEGYSYEGNASFKKTIKRINYYASGAVYSRLINNWILWLPGAGANPSPVNLQKVWSRGTETNFRISYSVKKWQFNYSFLSSYVLSTVMLSKRDFDNAVNRQLMYTPRYLFNTVFSTSYKKFNISYNLQYTGYRFTTSDNSAWLEPYCFSTLRLNQSVLSGSTYFTFFISCNNLFNSNYTILAGRPMPLRNYEIGITLKTKNKNI